MRLGSASLASLSAIALTLGATEGLAYWWMHPSPAGLGQPVLAYRPQMGDRGSQMEDRGSRMEDRGSQMGDRGSKIEDDAAIPSLDDPRSTIHDPPSSSYTPLPDVCAQAAPMLRCSSGQVLHVKLDDTIGLHLAFFEWDGTDTGSVLEAFRHMPEACMGSIGMTLVSKEKPIAYTVGQDRRASPLVPVKPREDGLVANGARNARTSASSSPIQHSTSKIDNSKLPQPGPTLSFDHTVFREPGQTNGLAVRGPQVHAFRAVWVAGMPAANARTGLGGVPFDHLRAIRIHCALTRSRPAYARVIQGAVRGAPNPAAAWLAFEQSMLADLRME
ncbi:MAG: hypothetical protein NTV46_21770 [Verrucomicrobia bacterium]|nr:hypothetical protein [Verrucomicrobiota bacterium]